MAEDGAFELNAGVVENFGQGCDIGSQGGLRGVILCAGEDGLEARVVETEGTCQGGALFVAEGVEKLHAAGGDASGEFLHVVFEVAAGGEV